MFHVIFSFVHFISLFTLGGLRAFRKHLPYNMYLFNLRIANHILIKNKDVPTTGHKCPDRGYSFLFLLASSVRTDATVSCSYYWPQVSGQILQFCVPTGLKCQDRCYSFVFLLLAASVRTEATVLCSYYWPQVSGVL